MRQWLETLAVGVFVLIALAFGGHDDAHAQQQVYAPAVASCGSPPNSPVAGNPYPLTQDLNRKLCVNATVSASVSGFTPNGSYGTPLSVSNSSSETALPTGASVAIQNVGSSVAYVNLGTSGSVTSTTSDIAVPAGGGCVVTVGSNTNIAAITASSTTTLNLAGGAGLGDFCYAGTGSGGGGGGAVTIASGAVASGAYSSGAFASGSIASGALASGACALGCIVDLGTGSSPAANTTNSYLKTLSGAVSSTLFQTNIADWDGTALGAPSNYGTSPGAVAVPGVNAFITNTPAVNPAAAATGGATPVSILSANSTNATNIKASAGTLYHISVQNDSTSALAYIIFFNTASTPTCTGTPYYGPILIPYVGSTGNNGSGVIEDIAIGLNFSTGISYCITTAPGGTGSVAASQVSGGLGYK